MTGDLVQRFNALSPLASGRRAKAISRMLVDRRRCMERVGEMSVQEALATQLFAEADLCDERAAQAGLTDTQVKVHLAKAAHLRQQAMNCNERVVQAQMELTHFLNLLGVKE